MCTCSISAKVGNKIKSVECLMKGHPLYTGRILLDYYCTQKRIERLLSFGDISILGESTDCPEGHTYLNPLDGYCVFLGRDGGKGGMDCGVPWLNTLECSSWEDILILNKRDFNYFWDGETWFVQ